MFAGHGMRIYVSDDTIGVELGGILKNVIAIAAGIADGLDLGDSARAGLISRGLAEMLRLSEKLGAKRETLFGLSGLGDLVMTATCDTSRNRTFGRKLGEGKSLEVALKEINSEVEGATTTSTVKELAKENNVEMPISSAVYEVINGANPKDVLLKLMDRPIKQEF